MTIRRFLKRFFGGFEIDRVPPVNGSYLAMRARILRDAEERREAERRDAYRGWGLDDPAPLPLALIRQEYFDPTPKPIEPEPFIGDSSPSCDSGGSGGGA